MKLEFKLGALPFAMEAFEPKLSVESFSFHYDKHHKAYVQNLGKFLNENIILEYKINTPQNEGAENKHTVSDQALVQIIKASYKKSISDDNFLFENVFLGLENYNIKNNAISKKNDDIDALRFDASLTSHKRIFNNAAQHWNHAFFWESITPDKKEIPSKLALMIEEKWGSITEFEKAFYNNAASLFGSGWVWLVYDKIAQKLDIIQTVNAETPILTQTLVPLLACDAWEHAYYIDYRNKRVDYLAEIIPHFNWQFACENLEKLI